MGNNVSLILRTISPLLAEHANYIFGIEDNIEAMKRAIVDLEARSLDVQTEVNVQKRQGLQPLNEVLLWLSRVEAIGPQVLLLLEGSSVQIRRLCMYGICFNDFGFTYPYGKMVSKMLKKVELLLSSKPGEVVARRGHPPLIEVAPPRRTIGLEKMLESTWETLMGEKVGILGIYGMGGIGKTTLLDEINNKFLEKRDEFHVVIYVVVSQDLQIDRIQNEIGKRLGLHNMEWEQLNKKQKASAIYKVFAKMRFVILLDDIWRKVDLEDIGIPLPSRENKSKVVFTTRSKRVCGRMGADVDKEVTCLDKGNAWKLFEQKVSVNTLQSHPMIPELARIVCEKCKGLPLALTVIGETMSRKNTVRDWRHAIEVLTSNVAAHPEVEEEIFKILKFSYDDLKDLREKQCFQYCALIPEDKREDKTRLVDYWICEGIINGGGDREEVMNLGYGIISTLIGLSLLTNYENGETVMMHDVIRQLALWIASHFGEQKENFVVKTGSGLHQMPEVGDWNAVERMSLENNEIQNISVTPECSNLKTLILRQNKLVNISGGFFRSMPKLLVLDLSGNKHLRELPEEISMLVSLRYLGLAETQIYNLPEGLRELIQLRHLDLMAVQTHPSLSVISSLENLETLLVDMSTPLSLELIEHINSLKYLKVLSVSINDFSVLERLLSIQKLASCINAISLVEIKATDVSFATVMVSLCTLVIESCFILDIMKHTRHISFQKLHFVKLTDVRGIQDLTWLSCAPNLSSLFVIGPSLELQKIISAEKVSGMKPFENLSILYLQGLMELRSVYWEPLDFKHLELFLIYQCPKLKKLPLNEKSAKGINIRLYVDSKEWLDSVEWEDEATKYRFERLSQVN